MKTRYVAWINGVPRLLAPGDEPTEENLNKALLNYGLRRLSPRDQINGISLVTMGDANPELLAKYPENRWS